MHVVFLTNSLHLDSARGSGWNTRQPLLFFVILRSPQFWWLFCFSCALTNLCLVAS
jgi:hypothetical protein